MNTPWKKIRVPKGSPLRYRLEKWFWVAMIVIGFATGLVNSVAFVSFLSVYALVVTLAGAEQAAEAKVAVQESNEESKSD